MSDRREPSQSPVPPDRSTEAAQPPVVRRRRRRARTITLVVIALLAVGIAALVGYALSDRGLPYIVARIVAQTGGRITIEDPTGSVAGTMRFRRITWRGADATVTADDVVVDWSPGSLWSRRLSIRGLGARHVDIELKPSTGPTAPPTDLRLPLAVDIEQLAIAQLDWRAGPRPGRISGLEFGYSGDARSHRIRRLRLVSDFGKLEGDLSVGAVEPLAIAGSATISGDGLLAGAQATTTLTGTVAQIGIAGNGTLRDAALSLQATATPFAAAPFASAIADLTGVDATKFDPALPHTRARVHLDLTPRGAGIAGSVTLDNDDAGPIDDERLPIARMSSRFVYADDALALDDLDATLAGGGGARGSGRIEIGGARSVRVSLDVRDLDLVRLHSKLVATRLSGQVRADATATRQTLEGDVRDRDVGLAFAAVIADERVEVSRFQATTRGGSLRGSARMALNDTNAFTVDATMQRLDPSRFVAVPPASIDGRVGVRGVLRPRWRADANVTVASGSRIDGVPASGTVKGTVAQGTLRDATIDLLLASASVHASGAAGIPGDRLTYTIDAPRIADIDALVPASIPRPLAGEAHASGALALSPGSVGGSVDIRAKALRAGAYSVQTLHGQASLAPAPTGSRATLGERALALDVTATQLVMSARTIENLHATVSGPLSRHHATLDLKAQDIDVALALDGALTNLDKPAQRTWNGTLASFVNRGAVPVRLRAPATFTVRERYFRIADAHVDAAGGTADIGELAWDDGRITTRGAFSGIAVANVARLAGVALPLETTLVAGGEFAIAAAPRLNGTFSIRRQSGDVLADLETDGTAQRRGLGITALTIAGRFDNDALDATATFASERAGTANASVAIGASGASSGRIDPAASLRLTLRAELASLAVFQPWFGTSAALGGRAHLDVAASGTVGSPLWSGAVTGEDLRIDAPQYGISATNGRLRAHLTTDGIALDDVHFTGGDGTFTASGLIALPGGRGAAPTRVTWKAKQFRATNRPDLRLVLDGDGTMALHDKRLALSGNITVVEGHVEYDPTPTGELASDIIVKGRTQPSRTEAERRSVPLALDVDVDLGRALTFTGEGIDTGLAGRVRITTSPSGALIGRGTIRAVNGTYVAFGQKLTIDRGRLIFDGPLENPALDVVALRKNLAVEAGVELTGTVKLPQVRVTSNPPVPENEALAWLVTGQGLSNSSRVDYAALSAASAALLGRNGKPITAQIAQSIGIDDISLKSNASASGAEGTAASQVVVFGKRISDRLSLGYEQGLSLATSAVRLEYALSRQVTLRAEAGQVSGVGIVYRRNFQ
jgi:translocation and assembly module TamB